MQLSKARMEAFCDNGAISDEYAAHERIDANVASALLSELEAAMEEVGMKHGSSVAIHVPKKSGFASKYSQIILSLLEVDRSRMARMTPTLKRLSCLAGVSCTE